MRTRSRLGSLLAVIVLSGVASACPGCDEKDSPSPAGPSAPTVTSVEIVGPATVAPGQSVQFTALVRLSSGVTKTATAATVRWRSSSSSLQVAASGLATASQQGGEATLTAEVPAVPASGTRRATRDIVVVPDGTYRLVGLVGDAEAPSTVPIVGARVEVVGGTPAAITGSDGRYRLYGVPPSAQVQVTRSGYQSVVQSVQLAEHATQNFALALAGPRLSLAGNYTLTVEVVDGCPGSRPLPADLRRRSYDAVLTQSGPTAEVTLTELPRFNVNRIGRGNRFSGRVDAAGAAFTLLPYSSYYYYYYGATSYPSVAERLPNSTVLEVSGAAVVAGSGILTGTLNGSLNNWGPRFPAFGDLLQGCTSGTHRFTLTPR